MQTCLAAVEIARSIKVLYSLNRRHLPEVILVAESYPIEQSLRDNARLIETLVPCGRVLVVPASSGLSDTNHDEVDVTKWSKQDLPGKFCLYLKLDGQVDAREKQRISQKLAKLEATRVKLQTKLEKSERPEDRSK